MAISKLFTAALLASVAISTGALGQTVPVRSADEPGAALKKTSGILEQEAGVADIVVTAQLRKERLEDVPASLVAVTSDQLQQAGVVNLQDISNLAAGVQINFAGCCAQPAIRGISTLTTGFGYENNVALYVDGFYSPDNVTVNSDLGNIAGVEVLKGPQGTLYGRNATGGVILINTLAPSNVLTGKFEVGYGRFQDISASGYISGPVTDNIRFSIAAYRRISDGYNTFLDAAGAPIGNATPTEQVSVRAKLEIDIGDLVATLGYNYGISSDGRGNLYQIIDHAPSFLPPAPPRASQMFQFSSNRLFANVKATVKEPTLKLALDTGIGILTSRTSYGERRLVQLFDFDGSWLDLFAGDQEYDQSTFQQNVDFSTNVIEGLDLVVGASYFDDKLEGFQLSYASNAAQSILTTTVKKQAWAAFADATVNVTPELAITVGGRYTNEKASGIYQNTNLITNALIGVPGGNAAEFSAFTPRASVRYQLAPRTNIYASVSRGFRSGGFTANGAPSPAEYLPFNPEKITAYEVGFKTARSGLRFDAAAFFYDYSDLQVGVTVPRQAPLIGVVNQVINAKRAEVYGIDADLNIEPIEGLNVHLGAAWTHARYTDFATATGTGLNAATGLNVTNQPQDWSGKQMTRAPNFSGNLGVNYEVQHLAGGRISIGANARYTDSYITNAASLYGPLAGAALANEQRFRQPAYVLVNAQIKWTDSSDHFHVQVWGNNLTDERYRLTYNGGAFGDYVSWASPVTYGVRFGYDF